MTFETLPHHDQRHLQASLGWLELGLWLEANEELERITPQHRATVQVLYQRCLVYLAANKWDYAFEVARHLTQVWPEEPACWISQAQALRNMPSGGPKQAWDSLIPIAHQFPTNAEIPYMLAGYAAQMNDITEAGIWLMQAIKVGDGTAVRLKALDDPDFEPLWKQIGKV